MELIGGNLREDFIKMKKLLKPQVERRRRERMNRSLESLRALLLQGPQHQGLQSRRVEKAEILEHTVHFLQKAGHKGTDEGSQQQHFQDGFSACLQRAARFLRDDGEGKQVERALTITLSRHLTPPGQTSRTPITTHSVCTQSKTQSAQLLRHNWHCRQQLCSSLRNNTHPNNRVPLAHGDPNLPQRPHRDAHAPPTNSQSVWRPWP
ncbi:transcription factor HES-7.1-B-like [Megalops cyprinoides]|uniref:transcription factor HES-7.1-B-like n=1 Tax=Megalops cyprinoides TaxID=118141 RepID=UPI001864B08B|nr:transcription factor HES-7.1-B-like [Megalops cyprinoides]